MAVQRRQLSFDLTSYRPAAAAFAKLVRAFITLSPQKFVRQFTRAHCVASLYPATVSEGLSVLGTRTLLTCGVPASVDGVHRF